MRRQPRKIVVTGPESTGKSTLSAGLAAALGTVWVPEYAREYLEQRANKYTRKDLAAIAAGQVRAEDDALSAANDWLVCDTDLYVLKVWSEHSYGAVDDMILQEIAARHYDLYLLCAIDMPWTPDHLREHGDPEERLYFYRRYHDIVVNSGCPWIVVSGTEQERLQQALDAVRAL